MNRSPRSREASNILCSRQRSRRFSTVEAPPFTTTPNPTGGYFVIVPRRDVIELDMTVDQALKYIISMGVAPPLEKGVAPPEKEPNENSLLR